MFHHHQVIKSPPRSTTLSDLPEADGGFGLHSPRWPDGLGRPDVSINEIQMSLSRLLRHPREDWEWYYSVLTEPHGGTKEDSKIKLLE